MARNEDRYKPTFSGYELIFYNETTDQDFLCFDIPIKNCTIMNYKPQYSPSEMTLQIYKI